MQIRAIDPHDDAGLRQWHGVYLEADTYGRPFVTPWQHDEMVAMLRGESESYERLSYLGYVDGEPVASLGAQLPLRDNLSVAMFLQHTLPAHRRRGWATRMLVRLQEDLASRGRTVLQSHVDFAYDRGPQGAGEPGVEYLLAQGFTLGLGDVQRTLELPVRESVLTRIAQGAAPYHAGYLLVPYVGRCPDEHVDSYARLFGTFADEVPAGEMTFEAEAYDAARVRSDESTLAAAGRTSYVVLALSPDGAVVAFTQLVVPRHDPGKVFQWGTLVHPDHRGHRLGLAVKAANHAQLQRHEPGRATCYTKNAEVNEHMIAVNDLLGYRLSARSGEFEKRLT